MNVYFTSPLADVLAIQKKSPNVQIRYALPLAPLPIVVYNIINCVLMAPGMRGEDEEVCLKF
jgi:hypothetical protein